MPRPAQVPALIVVVAGSLLAACGPGGLPSTSASAGTLATPSGPTPTATSVPAPTRTTSLTFKPSFTYTASAGWIAAEDWPAQFRLLPAGYSNDDFDHGVTDGITLINGIAAANLDCTDTGAPGVARDPDSIGAELASRPGIAVTSAAASIGGLSGTMLDVRLAAGWTTSCPDPPGVPTVPLINGPTYNQRIGGGTLIRLYLLGVDGPTSGAKETLAIEIDDLTGGSHIERLSSIVGTFEFTN